MYITSEQHEKLAQGLFDKMIELRDAGEKRIKAYEIALQNVIEEVFPDKHWHDITSCNIHEHLMECKNPEKTIISILKSC